MGNYYQLRKGKARDEAIEWQITSMQYNYSYGELCFYYDYFLNLGKRFGLIKEFRENCII